MEELKAGNVVTLEAIREADFGIFLTDGKTDVLLHKSEMSSLVALGDEVEVFLYNDKQGRVAASMTIPKLQIGTFDWCEVVSLVSGLGVFIDIGLKKDILIHKDDLPKIERVWPKAGDQVYSTLKTDKNGWLYGKLATESDMEPLFQRADRSAFNKNVSGIVYRTLKSGSFVLTDEGYRGFIHESQRENEPRIGERVTGRIIDVKDDGSVNLSLLKRGYEVLDDDAERIFQYLVKRGGKMPYTDKSRPEEIMTRFGMSKAAFKRALGRLMKEGKVYQKEGWTFKKDE